MASKELIQTIQSYDEYAKYNGVTDKLISAYLQGIEIAYLEEKDIQYGHEISVRARQHIDDFLVAQTGGHLKENEEYAQEHKVDMDVLDWYYQTLWFDAPHFLDSYALYIERDRPRKDRFYEPRRKTLIRVSNKLQELEEDRLDELFVHQPP